MPLPFLVAAFFYGTALAGGVCGNIVGVLDHHGQQLQVSQDDAPIIRKNQMETGYRCDLYHGKWRALPDLTPYYTPQTCPFLSQQFDCHNNGRKNTDYARYVWTPEASCTYPPFEGLDFLKRFKGKRIMFVGDSIGHSQWLSFVCMLHATAPKAKYALRTKGDLSTVTYPAYNVSVVFSRNDFLVDVVGHKSKRILKLDSIEKGEAMWKGVDVLVFNTWSEGLQTAHNKWDLIQEGKATHKDMDPLVVFEKALNTWAKWVKSTFDTKKTKILVQALSPDHTKAKSCKSRTKPVPGNKYHGGRVQKGEAILEKVLGKISKRIPFLNITEMSSKREDGHPSSYGGRKAEDCIQWCLPGIPDNWNQLLYANLLHH